MTHPLVPRTTVIITDEARLAIYSASNNLHFEGKRLPDGTWETSLQNAVLELLYLYQLPGETISDTIIRSIRHYNGLKPS